MAGGDSGDAARRWERVQEIFHRALEVPAGERDTLVRQECADDEALAAEVRAMLAADDAGGEMLAGGLAAAADRMLDDPSAVVEGRRFGPYRTVGLLGEGGMGVVLRAMRDDLGSEAAVKVLRDFSLSPARRERFAFEQRALAQLDHPGIARLFDADVLADGTPWFAMELVEGLPLNEYCAARQLGVEARLEIFLAVCEAVQHAHSRAILHRDLKPSNILVRPDGRVKLLDFGIAKSIETLETPGLVTRTGLRMMTPAYASPEQMSGEGVGVHSDVYSLGVLLFELLAGRLPFDLAGRTPSEAARILAEQPMRAPSTITAELRPSARAGRDGWRDLDVICLTAMHRDVARRYPTVDALRSDIERFLAGLPVRARGDSFGYLAGKFVRRNAAQVGLAMAALVLTIGVATVYTWRLNVERDRAERMATRAQRVQEFMQQLFRGEDEQIGPSDTLRVVTLLHEGMAQAGALASEPEAQADLRWTLGKLMFGRGQLDHADSLLVPAYRFVVGSKHPEPADEVGLTTDLGMLRAHQERWQESERLLRKAVARAAMSLPPRDPSAISAVANLGSVLAKRGSSDEGARLLNDALDRMKDSGEVTDLMLGTLSDLAILSFNTGDGAAADSLFRRVAAL
ncbi:MAG: serine/threonine protein kinase, partial [Candidatus Eisenbacteria bacterium]|nr:serine/threonine protein kinase [Candidatus Eisenbacteria bacterium]